VRHIGQESVYFGTVPLTLSIIR